MVLEVQDSGCAEEVVTNHWREIRGTSGMLVIVFLICVHVGGVRVSILKIYLAVTLICVLSCNSMILFQGNAYLGGEKQSPKRNPEKYFHFSNSC